jgi:hypothetical protein
MKNINLGGLMKNHFQVLINHEDWRDMDSKTLTSFKRIEERYNQENN